MSQFCGAALANGFEISAITEHCSPFFGGGGVGVLLAGPNAKALPSVAALCGFLSTCHGAEFPL